MFGGKWLRKNPLNIKQSTLCILWSKGRRLHSLPIKVEGFLLAARVRNNTAWYLWNGFRVCNLVSCFLRISYSAS